MKELLQKYDKYSQESRDMQDQGIHAEGDLPNDPDACKYRRILETMEELGLLKCCWSCVSCVKFQAN